jgi:hypothetical protein
MARLEFSLPVLIQDVYPLLTREALRTPAMQSKDMKYEGFSRKHRANQDQSTIDESDAP